MADQTSRLTRAPSSELLVDQLSDIADRIADAKATAVDTIIAIGGDLNQAHELLAGAGRDGMFRPWVEKQCGFSISTAYNYINAHKTFGDKFPTVGHFFDARAVYLLSSNKCLEAATEALQIAEAGNHITLAIAKKLIQKQTVGQRDDATDTLPTADTPPTASEDVGEDTAKTLRDVVEEENPVVTDANGEPIPENLLNIFAKVTEYDEKIRDITALQQWAKKIEGEPWSVWLHLPPLIADLANVKRAIKFSKPFAVCPYCRAKPGTCKACHDGGFVPQSVYQAAPKEMRV